MAFSGKLGPFVDVPNLYWTDTAFWAQATLCTHSAECQDCCWDFFPLDGRLTKLEQKERQRVPRYHNQVAVLYGWERVHGRAEHRAPQLSRICHNALCVNPAHVRGLRCASERPVGHQIVTCDHIMSPQSRA